MNNPVACDTNRPEKQPEGRIIIEHNSYFPTSSRYLLSGTAILLYWNLASRPPGNNITRKMEAQFAGGHCRWAKKEGIPRERGHGEGNLRHGSQWYPEYPNCVFQASIDQDVRPGSRLSPQRDQPDSANHSTTDATFKQFTCIQHGVGHETPENREACGGRRCVPFHTQSRNVAISHPPSLIHTVFPRTVSCHSRHITGGL